MGGDKPANGADDGSSPHRLSSFVGERSYLVGARTPMQLFYKYRQFDFRATWKVVWCAIHTPAKSVHELPWVLIFTTAPLCLRVGVSVERRHLHFRTYPITCTLSICQALQCSRPSTINAIESLDVALHLELIR